LSIFEELKRRNVFRVSIAYVVAAWLLLQLTEVLTELLALPDVMGKAVVLFLVIGFPVAIFFAWAFELTPDGIKREHEVDRSQSVTPGTGKKLNNLILVMMAVAIVYLLYDKFSGQTADVDSTQVVEVATEVAEQEALALGIAVLPFANLSANEENAFFAGGIHEEILTNLSRIADLRVISRTSMLRIAETDLDIRAMGKRLGVSHILEGSVRRAGDRVRVTVQLIDAERDEHLWAENYDRTLTDIFAIQSDIALAIARQLKAELSPEALASIQEVPTDNTEAYDFYLQAREEASVWRGSEGFEAMKPLLEQAVALDPNFLRAQVSLVSTYGRLLWTGADPDRIYGAKALELVTDIRRRWPDRIEGHLALGYYYYTVERNYERALAEFRLFEEVFPNDLEMLQTLASSLKRLGRVEEHLRYTRRIVELDPERSASVGELVQGLRSNGQVEEILVTLDNAARKFPEDPKWPSQVALARLFYLGDVKGYLAFGEQLRKENRWDEGLSVLTWMLYGHGDVQAALEHIDASMGDEYDWGDTGRDTDRVLILRMEGRENEAQIAADRALNFVKSWIDEGRPFQTTTTKFWYTLAAYIAAVAGDLEMVADYRQRAADADEDELFMAGRAVIIDAEIDALLGDATSGWAKVSVNEEMQIWYLTAEYAAVHPYYQYLFGDVPAYQEFISQAEIAD